VWEQLAVSLAGIVVMIGVAWLLDRAERIPNLFVDVLEVEEPEPALDDGKTAAVAAARVSG
jgi:hypothetical protein